MNYLAALRKRRKADAYSAGFVGSRSIVCKRRAVQAIPREPSFSQKFSQSIEVCLNDSTPA